jgi:hypothetical protein
MRTARSRTSGENVFVVLFDVLLGVLIDSYLLLRNGVSGNPGAVQCL